MGTSQINDSPCSPEVIAEHSVEEENSRENINQNQEVIDELCEICGTVDDRMNQRPLNIVFIGKLDAGKSSFINGVTAALSGDRWRERVYTGKGTPVTKDNKRLEKCCNRDRERYHNVLLPTLIDVAGLPDEADDKLEELLRLLFYGHIEEGERLMNVYENIRNRTEEDIRQEYNLSYPEMRVDRVVFVASASAEDPLPVNLMDCVYRAAQPSHHRAERRAVPLYGVLTKMDKVDVKTSDYQQKEKKFIKILKLNQTRFLVCSNYCDDIDPKGERCLKLRPELDLPVLRFMQQVCGNFPGVLKDDEVLPPSGAKPVADQRNVARVGVGVLALAMLLLLVTKRWVSSSQQNI